MRKAWWAWPLVVAWLVMVGITAYAGLSAVIGR